MKYEFYCKMDEDVRTISFLKSKGIKYDTGSIPNRMYRAVYGMGR